MRNLIRTIALSLLFALPIAGKAAVILSVNIGPPVLPVYAPPPMPAPGFIWLPGYWAYDAGGYYWVPGTWSAPPAAGLLWTPGYWGWAGGAYVWHAGYWGPHVGFYGGINYGFGYGGVGFHGGYWNGGRFIADPAALNDRPINHFAFNGPGGIVARANAAEMLAARDHHIAMSEEQLNHERMAARDNTMRASFNHGAPRVAATARPGVFYGHGVVAAHAGGEFPHAAPVAAHGPAGAPGMGHPGGEPPHGAYGGAAHAPEGAPHGAPGYSHAPAPGRGEPGRGEPNRGGERDDHGRPG
jgi:hypothetical protein